MKEKRDRKAGRIRWPVYAERERDILERKFLGDWQSLDFLDNFWNPIYDERDLFQYLRTAGVWRMRLIGKTFDGIEEELQVDKRKACALVSGKNLRPFLVQMYLNSQLLSKPRTGWKWVLDCSPKPTNMFPRAVEVPDKIQSYQDVLDFLKQFPPVPADHPAIRLFGLSSEWVGQHKPELFGFLLGFLVGDAGKYVPEYLPSARHYGKTSLQVNMSSIESNVRVLTYVQLCLASLGMWSHEIASSAGVTRWTSETSNVLTWILRICLGLASNQRTSRNPVSMNWILKSSREFVIAFIHGVSESDGSVSKHGYYAAIASVPNANFYQRVLASIGNPSRTHPRANPTQLRINLLPATLLPLFNPIIKSYRFIAMVEHARRRKLLPPSSISKWRNQRIFRD